MNHPPKTTKAWLSLAFRLSPLVSRLLTPMNLGATYLKGRLVPLDRQSHDVITLLKRESLIVHGTDGLRSYWVV